MRVSALILAAGLFATAALAEDLPPLPGKNPGQAVIYSMTFPGLGQVYNEQYRKAAWHATGAWSASACWGASVAGDSASSAKPANVRKPAEEDDVNPGLAAAGVATYVGMWVYPMRDADREARAFNRTHRMVQRLRMEPLAMRRGAGAQVRLRF